MQANNNRPGNYTQDGSPIIVPGDGSLGMPTIFSGVVKDRRNDASEQRGDERFVYTEFNNLTIDSGGNYVALDAYEAGELHNIVVVSDNPYLQVYVQIDDFRNQEPNGITVAELLYNGNLTQLSQRRFRAIDGQSPTVGYGMVFEPQKPLQYTNRIRVILYNNVKSNGNIYGKDLHYRSSATMPTPAVPAHMAGASFEQSSLASVSLVEMASAMTTPVGSPAYFSGKTYNTSALNGQLLSGMILGTDHPYVGLAGRPSFSSDPSSKFIPQEKVGSSTRNAPYRLTVREEAERFPGTTTAYSNMILDIKCQIGESGVLKAGGLTDASFNAAAGFGLYHDSANNIGFDSNHADFPIGKRMFYRVGGEVAMLGVCTAISLTHANESTNELVPAGGASVIGLSTTESVLSDVVKGDNGAGTGTWGHTFAGGATDYNAPEFHLKIEPGLSGKGSDFATEILSGASATDGTTETSEYARWGLVTSQADTNPQIFVKKIDIRRRKVYSKRG